MSELYDTGYRGYLYAASKDICAIEDLSARFEINVESICFHAAQAAEKMVKNVFRANDTMPPQTHDVRALLRRAINNSWIEATDDELAAAQLFKFFSTSGKYEEEPDITISEAQEALVCCNKIADMLSRNGYEAVRIPTSAHYLRDEKLVVERPPAKPASKPTPAVDEKRARETAARLSGGQESPVQVKNKPSGRV